MRLIQNLLFALAVCGFAASGASASPAAPKSGAEYETLPTAQPTNPGAKVDVIEFFSYSCPHCNAFEPKLHDWVSQNADKINFKRVHVAFHSGDTSLQRMYLTMEAMGIAEQYHQKVFNTIHDERVTRLSTDEQVFDWIEKKGGDRAKFMGAYRSFGAQAWVNRAQATIGAYNIDQWPVIAIGGRYLTSPHFASRAMPPPLGEVEQHQAALQVMDFLVAKAKSEKK
jgi:thiol:disulfide interchange protein DsbA